MDESEVISNEEYPLHPADPQILPASTYWPLAMAFGLLLFFWGFITTLILSGVGFICIIVSLAGWIIELNNE